MMKKIRLLLLILTLFLITYLICGGYLANASTGKTNNSLKEYLKTYNISFLIKADLNNDGTEEKITIYRQWDGEDPSWSDDQWYILLISDHKGNVLYMKDVSYFQEVGHFAVKDRDGDGLKEIVVSLDQAECWDAKTQIYGWEIDSYKLIGEFKTGDSREYMLTS